MTQTPPLRPQNRDLEAEETARLKRTVAAKLRSSRRRLYFYVQKFTGYLTSLMLDDPAIRPDVLVTLDALLAALQPAKQDAAGRASRLHGALADPARGGLNPVLPGATPPSP